MKNSGKRTRKDPIKGRKHTTEECVRILSKIRGIKFSHLFGNNGFLIQIKKGSIVGNKLNGRLDFLNSKKMNGKKLFTVMRVSNFN